MQEPSYMSIWEESLKTNRGLLKSSAVDQVISSFHRRAGKGATFICVGSLSCSHTSSVLSFEPCQDLCKTLHDASAGSEIILKRHVRNAVTKVRVLAILGA